MTLLRSNAMNTECVIKMMCRTLHVNVNVVSSKKIALIQTAFPTVLSTDNATTVCVSVIWAGKVPTVLYALVHWIAISMGTVGMTTNANATPISLGSFVNTSLV